MALPDAMASKIARIPNIVTVSMVQKYPKYGVLQRYCFYFFSEPIFL